MSTTDTDHTHRVVVNDEEQYSIWPASRRIPAGWHHVGVTGSEEECLAWIGTYWTDLRPLSLRRLVGSDGTRSNH
jgi:MbtH protein